MASDERGLVLVTGGSGYLAGFCIAQLLKEGWAVRTTVRQLSREPEVRTRLAQLVEPVGRLAFVPADLDSDAGWAEAVAGCAYVLHVASPLPARNPRDDEELTRPARDGALRVLRRARDAEVRRVVMTASTASIAYGHGGRSEPFTEADWSDETNRADTLAEGLAVRVPDKAALAIILKHAARIVTVSDAEIRHAARAMFADTRNVAEGASAAPLAAALQERARLQGRRVALIQSGGNIERSLLAELLLDADPG